MTDWDRIMISIALVVVLAILELLGLNVVGMFENPLLP
jgi:hypothetical protein